MQPYNQVPLFIQKGGTKDIACFELNVLNSNLDAEVVASFGEEWTKFSQFNANEIDLNGKMYFDIVDESILKDAYIADFGCGTGRWSKYLAPKVKFIEAIDPSDAILVADGLLAQEDNVRLSRASIDNLPFSDETFDFAMSVGVLHHIPDTQKAMSDCVKKVKIGGYFFIYLYYNFENRGLMFKAAFWLVNLLRLFTSTLPSILKKITCDFIAFFIYVPIVSLVRILQKCGFESVAKKLPLYAYHDQSLNVIRNDALDRFGTTLEQRFSREQITIMMQNAGLSEIKISNGLPFWHAIGKRVK